MDEARRRAAGDLAVFQRRLDHEPEQVEVEEMHDAPVGISLPVAVDDARRNRPETRKKSGMRKGRAKATTWCMKPSPPIASPTPSVACIITTRMMQRPLAVSTQGTRPSSMPPA